MSGWPSRRMIVGVSVVRGRLPGLRALGSPSHNTKACMRFPSGTPVSPAMNTPPENQADEGEAENKLPFQSTVSTVVVSGDGGRAVARDGGSEGSRSGADMRFE